MSKSLNKTVADFEYQGHKYEIDLLLDSLGDGYATYDVFDVTKDKVGNIVCQLDLEQQEEDDYMPSELIEMAIEEIELTEEAKDEYI